VIVGLHARCSRRWPQLRAVQCAGRFNREGLAIEVDLSLPSARVIRTLQQVMDWRGKPRVIRCDNDPECISGTLLQWAAERQIRIEYIQPDKPQQNAYVERYNRTVRYDWLAQHIFASIDEVQEAATAWLWAYNNERPNMALGGFTDAEVGDGCLVPPPPAAVVTRADRDLVRQCIPDAAQQCAEQQRPVLPQDVPDALRRRSHDAELAEPRAIEQLAMVIDAPVVNVSAAQASGVHSGVSQVASQMIAYGCQIVLG
jgi:hypothetical protein